MVCQGVKGYSFSKHIYDKQNHPKEEYISGGYQTEQEIIPLLLNKAKTTTSAVFGYLPYWVYPDAEQYLQYDLLSHISIFDFGITEAGGIEFPPNWPWIDVINNSHQNGVKVILTAVNFNGSQIHNILHNTDIKNALFSNLLSVLQQYSLDGVNIDFENINYSDRGFVLVGFMLDLSNYLHSYNPNYEISFAAPPVNWGGWDFEGLALSCDYLFIMGYDFYGPWSNTSGPCAPTIGGNYNITNVILDEYETVTVNNPEKLILGVPYYGNKWKTSGGWPYSTVLDHVLQPTYEGAMNNAEQDTILWDETSKTSWSLYENNGNFYQTWFDTDSSLGIKYDIAQNNLLKGVGIWALGYDGSRLELWEELRKRYGNPVFNVENSKNVISNIYPNPFSGKTRLEIYGERIQDYSITVFDFQGNKINPSILEINTHKRFSIYEVDMTNYDSGVYFVSVISYKQEKAIIDSRIIIKK